MPSPVDNTEPYLVLNQGIVLSGTYPSRGGGSGDIDSLGVIRTFAGSYVPGGFADVGGQLLSIQSNAALYSVLGNNFGGDGKNNFALPDLHGRVAIGSSSTDPFGQADGTDAVTLTPNQVPASAGGGQQPFSNEQPELALTFAVRVEGIYPSSGSNGAPGNLLGEIVEFAGNYQIGSDGGSFLPADGRILNISQYEALYSLFGNRYGGDGNTTFALPNLTGRDIVGQGTVSGLAYTVGQQLGQDAVTLTQANLPPSSGGSGQPFDNQQPGLVLTYAIATVGIFPPRDGGGGGFGDGDPYLGEVRAFALLPSQLPSGWHVADGALLSVNQNPALYALLSNTYGGSGQTTFALPNLSGRVVLDTGARASDGDNFVLGQTGGTAYTTLTDAQTPVINAAPVAKPDQFTTNEDTPLTVATASLLANDTDADNDPLTVTAVGNAQHGTVSLTGGNIVFTPEANFNGAGGFSYTIQDGYGHSASATVAVNVTPVNDAPSFNNSITGRGIYEDYGPDSILYARNVSAGPNEGGQTVSFIVTNDNTALFSVQPSVSPSGVLTYTPAPNAYGTATVTVVLKDNGGTANGGVDTSAPHFLTIEIISRNDAPSGADKTIGTLEDTAHVFSAADFGFSDPSDAAGPGGANNLAAVIVATLPGAGTLSNNGVAVTAGQAVSVADINAGLLKFAPAADANGAGYASFTFQVRDDGGTVGGGVNTDPTPNTLTLDVTPVNDAPTATNLSGALTLAEDAAAQKLFALAPDLADVDSASLTATLTLSNLAAGQLLGAGQATNGVYTLTGTAAELKAALAAITFQPAADFNGAASVSVSVTDGQNGPQGANPTGVIALTLTPVNDPPVLSGDGTINLLQGGTTVLKTADLAVSDIDNAPAELTYTVTAANHGQVLLDGQAAASFTEAQLEAGRVAFRQDGGTAPDAGFTVTVSDGQATVGPKTVAAAVDLAPTITGVSYGANDGTLKAGEGVDLTVRFSEAVTLTDPTVVLKLSDGGTATYVSGNGSTTLVFHHDVAAGQTTPDLAVVGVSSGAKVVQDAGGNLVALTGAIANPDGILVVDTTAPIVSASATSASSPTNATGLTYTVAFSEAVTGVDAGDFAFVYADGTVAPGTIGTPTSTDGGATYTVGLTGTTGEGAAHLVLRDAGTGIADFAGNPIAGGANGATIVLDHLAPVLTLATIAGDDALNAAEKGGAIALSGTATGLEDGQVVTLALKNGAGTTTYSTATAIAKAGAFALTLAAGTASALADGQYLVTADTTDQAGNAAVQSKHALVIDTTADLGGDAHVTLDPSGDGSLSASEAGRTAFAITGLDADATGLVHFSDGTHVLDLGIGANGLYSADLSAFSGSVTATLALTDVHGNVAAGLGSLVSIEQAAPPAPSITDDGTIYGTPNADVINAGQGNSQVYALAGDDTVFGEGGGDGIYGGDGNDFIGAGSGDDLASGGDGNDEVHGEDGNDQLFGNRGNDGVYGEAGNDQVRGGEGDDRVFGGTGDDGLYGEEGNDFLGGGAGNDLLSGGAGDDSLVGEEGNDELWGNAGHDVFVFFGQFGQDRIKDLDVGGEKDLIAFGRDSFTSYAEVMSHAQQVGGDVVITAGSNTVTIEHTALATLTQDHFYFV